MQTRKKKKTEKKPRQVQNMDYAVRLFFSWANAHSSLSAKQNESVQPYTSEHENKPSIRNNALWEPPTHNGSPDNLT